MIYKNFKDIKTSLLGLGCMRFPVLPEDKSKIDYAKAQEIIDYAYEHGINYFDTAYIYNDGDSEKVIGRALKKYPRDSYYLATKLPGWQVGSEREAYEMFQTQLERCGVDYFDFYLCHNLNPVSWETYKKGFIVPLLIKLRDQGKIKHLGFSTHADADLIARFLDMYDCWEFVQIQLNYFDWEYLNVKSKYELLTERGIPIVVMEPVRGGRLASLCPEADELLLSANPEKSIASWAIRWAAGKENIQVVLSGMSDMAQVEDNVKTVSGLEPISDSEQEVIDKAVSVLNGKELIPCTQCRYCDGCPQGLDIPKIIGCYNDSQVTLGRFSLSRAFALPEEQRPGNCVSCGQCVAKCPQEIDIPEAFRKLAEKMDKAGSAPPPQ